MRHTALRSPVERPRLLAAITLTVVLTVALTGCAGGGTAEPVVTTPPASSDAPDPTPSAEETAAADSAPAAAEAAPVPGVPQPATWGEISTLTGAGARFLSCDTKADFGLERVKGATHVPLKDFESISSEWKESDVIVLVSQQEATARSGAGFLTRAGFENVYFLEGGHDAWDGTFEGSAARRATVPPRVIYLYSDDPSNSVLSGDMSLESLHETEVDLATELEKLNKEFPDIAITSYNRYKDPSGHDKAFEDYDVPMPVIEGRPSMTWPRWVLVDSDGRITHISGMTTVNTQIIYKFCVEQSAK